MAARGNKYMSFMLLRFLIIPFHKSYILLSPHTDTKVVQMLIGNSGKCCAKQIVNNASTEMMSFSWLTVLHLFFFFFPALWISYNEILLCVVKYKARRSVK